MRPPKDSEDFASHVNRSDGVIRVYCVECERWVKVVVIATATVTYRQNQWASKTENAQQPGYHCGTRACRADVDYLLSEGHKDEVLILAEVPILRPAKTLPPTAPLAMPPRQMRLL